MRGDTLSIQLTILPFGTLSEKDLSVLMDSLSFLPFKIKISSPIPIPSNSYNKRRNQYEASHFISASRKIEDSDKVLGVTNVDLYTPGLNFIFGQAEIYGKACVISTFRLRMGADGKTFISRMIKEAVHELGHTMGLRHCPDRFCVMYFSNCLADTDVKGERYCKDCDKLVKNFMK